MYTKSETFYKVVFRKSPKSYRANNYVTAPYEFRTSEAAERFITKYCEEKYNISKFCEAIIIEVTNKPVKTINF